MNNALFLFSRCLHSSGKTDTDMVQLGVRMLLEMTEESTVS